MEIEGGLYLKILYSEYKLTKTTSTEVKMMVMLKLLIRLSVAAPNRLKLTCRNHYRCLHFSKS